MIRIFSTFFNTEGIHGPVSFVPLEMERFEEGVMERIREENVNQLAHIYRHPAARCFYYGDEVNSDK